VLRDCLELPCRTTYGGGVGWGHGGVGPSHGTRRGGGRWGSEVMSSGEEGVRETEASGEK
jgi:hypothetical protein